MPNFTPSPGRSASITRRKQGSKLTKSPTHRVDEEEIDDRCDKLRKKLLAEMERNGNRGAPPRKGLKAHQVHELAEAKIKESERLRQALKISKDYEEGSHWKRQEERLRKATEREAETTKDEGEVDEED